MTATNHTGHYESGRYTGGDRQRDGGNGKPCGVVG